MWEKRTDSANFSKLRINMDDNQNQSNLKIRVWILSPAIVLNALFFGIYGNSWWSFLVLRAARMQVVNALRAT